MTAPIQGSARDMDPEKWDRATYRAQLKRALKAEAERDRYREALQQIRDCSPDGWTHDTARSALA